MLNDILTKIEQEFKEEYKKVYSNIFAETILKRGNKWFESFLRTSITSTVKFALESVRLEKVIKGLTPNPTHTERMEYDRTGGYNKAVSELDSKINNYLKEIK